MVTKSPRNQIPSPQTLDLKKVGHANTGLLFPNIHFVFPEHVKKVGHANKKIHLPTKSNGIKNELPYPFLKLSCFNKEKYIIFSRSC